MSLEGMVAAAERSLGLTGRPNYITRSYAERNGAYFANAAWCDMAVTFWARSAGEFQSVCFGTDFAYTVWHAQRFKTAGQWHTDVAGIRRGDIVFFDWAGTNEIAKIDHIGIVTGVSGSNVFTIEGNTLDSCARRVRHADTIAGYGRPKYKQPTGTRVKLADVAAAAKRDPAAPQGATTHKTSVMVVERALVAEGLLAARWVDGSFGSKTVEAYARWQRSKAGGAFTGADADGIPGKSSLSKLGTRHGFTVA